MPFETMSTTQQFTASIAPVNKNGKPAAVDGVPTWATSDASVALVTPAADGMTAVVAAQGVGTYTVTVSADADLGAGVTTIVGSDTGSVILGQATAIGITGGPVTEQP